MPGTCIFQESLSLSFLIFADNNNHRPVLVTMSSFRLIAGFLISFKSADMILALGYLKTFGIYAIVMTAFSLMLPLIYKYGKRMRLWSAGKFESSARKDADSKSMASIELTGSRWSETEDNRKYW